jgi:hypothetical protein
VREVRFPRVCHRSGSVQRACSVRALFLFRRLIALAVLFTCRGGACPAHSRSLRNPALNTPNAILSALDAQIADTYAGLLFSFELSTVDCELFPKKMSGRWGDRPLGRGGWRVLQPEASSVLPIVPLHSRAAERYTGAIRPKPFYSGSRNQLPITVTILRSTLSRVDSPTGSIFTVLPGVLRRLILVPTYLFRAIPHFSRTYKAAKMSRQTNR